MYPKLKAEAGVVPVPRHDDGGGGLHPRLSAEDQHGPLRGVHHQQDQDLCGATVRVGFLCLFLTSVQVTTCNTTGTTSHQGGGWQTTPSDTSWFSIPPQTSSSTASTDQISEQCSGTISVKYFPGSKPSQMRFRWNRIRWVLL